MRDPYCEVAAIAVRSLLRPDEPLIRADRSAPSSADSLSYRLTNLLLHADTRYRRVGVFEAQMPFSLVPIANLARVHVSRFTTDLTVLDVHASALLNHTFRRPRSQL